MMEKLTCLLLFAAAVVGVVQCTFGSTSEPLILTKYIEANQIYQGRTAAYVSYGELLARGIVSYSGYFTVNKTYDSNLFFWYFPAKNNAANAPVVVWLQGGPGAASVYGCLMENGPMTVNSKSKLEARALSWTQDHHMLYIDNPVGAGFSYTNNAAGYARNQVDVAANLYSAVRQFFQLWPELRNNGFYVTGESYGGKYVPALAYAIHSNRNSANVNDRINLKGIAIGNGVTDPVNQILFGDYYYQLGFIDKAALATFNQFQNAALSYIAKGDYVNAMKYTFYLVNSPGCLFNNLTGYTSPYHSLRPNGYEDQVHVTSDFLLKSGIAKSLHVGNRTFVAFSDTNVVLQYLVGDILDSVAPWVAELANYYKVFIYNGQMDLLVSTTLTENYLSRLSYNGASEFSTASRKFWKVGNDLAGYTKKGGNLYHITIRDAGHMAPLDQPVWTYDMLKRLTYGNGF